MAFISISITTIKPNILLKHASVYLHLQEKPATFPNMKTDLNSNNYTKDLMGSNGKTASFAPSTDLQHCDQSDTVNSPENSKQNTLSLYVHWPWCLKKCPYCDFNSHTNNAQNEKLQKEYLDTLISDLEWQSQQVNKRPLESIFFGGGTPSLMPPKFVEEIIQKAHKLFGLSATCEISLEANPTSSDAQKFHDFKSAGINRLSVGVQSLDEELLRFLGRQHSASEALKTIESAVAIFDNVNLDLIYGLPKQKIEQWEQDLVTAIKLGTKHISAYQLAIEENTIFHSEVKKKKWSPLDDDRQADFILTTQKILQKANFENYETSNYCLNGYQCRHNLQIWQYNDYLGIGAGAHGRYHTSKKLNNIHRLTQNHKNPKIYIKSVKNVKQHETVHFLQQNTTFEQRVQEKTMMGLRTKLGVSNFSEISHTLNKNKVNYLIKHGLLYTKGNSLITTEKGWLLLDGILSEIL